MSRFSTVDLSAHSLDVEGIKFLRAEVPTRGSPFVLIRYALGGVEQREALRIDLGKDSFLDEPDAEVGEGFFDAAPKIVKILRDEVVSSRTTHS